MVTAVDFVPDGRLRNTRDPFSCSSLPFHLLPPAIPAKRYDVDGNLFEIITSDETHYFLQAATAEERKEWIEAVQEVSKSGN